MTAQERFLRYVTFYTNSDAASTTSPSTMRQKDLGCALMDEMAELGLEQIFMDDCGNVIGTLPAHNTTGVPVVALVAHMDTSPDAPGEHVKPRVVRYEGGDLSLSDTVFINESFCPGLSEHIGKEIIVTDGTTLLGGDDKAGIAEIMTAVELLRTSGAPHGELRIIFTTDEEVGRGTEGLNVETLGCAYGYTLDGGALGEIEYENFNAASAILTVEGVGVHPGIAKDVMVNAAAVAARFQGMLPAEETPERTTGTDGFFHLHHIEGGVTSAKAEYIIRDHDRDRFEARKALFLSLAEKLDREYGPGRVHAFVEDSYYNMKEKILPHMHLIDRAKAAFLQNGVEPNVMAVRGGTDGANLSWAGLPCPNLSAGGYNAHCVREWIPAASLEIMAQVVADLAVSFAQ